MTYIPFELVGVIDSGVPNLERVCLKVLDFADLRKYFIGLGIRRGDNHIDPINDNSFWLGNNIANENDWIFIYSGGGKASMVKVPNQDNHVFTFHWGRSQVLFHSPEVLPYVYEINSVLLPNSPARALPDQTQNHR